MSAAAPPDTGYKLASPLQTSQPGSNRLPVLAATISEHIDAANAATRRALEHAIAAGALLIEAKELVGHGEWLPWLQANCRLSERQARTYMRLARHRHRLESAVTADLTIAAAEALVGKPKPDHPHGLPGQFDLLGLPPVPPPCVTAPEHVDPIADDLIDQLLLAAGKKGVSIESLCRAFRRRMGRHKIEKPSAPHNTEISREDFHKALIAADCDLRKVKVTLQ